MEIPLLKGILIIFSLSVAVLYVCHKLRVPALVGYLVTGIMAGPHGFQLVNEVHEVEMLAEIGIVLLLFTIGIEFSFDRLLQIKKHVLMGGSLQVVLTSLAAFVIAWLAGWSTGEAVFAGFLICLSSTAIVLKIIQERAEVDSPHGRASLGILIFQDMVIVPMILFTPVLAGVGGSVAQSLLTMLAKGTGIIILVIAAAKWIVPHLLFQVTRTRNRELFLLSIVVICLTVAWLTSSIGLSLALGAFLAGLIISESEYSHQALGSILPFRDVFTSFFFISIGMLLNIKYLLQNPGLVLVSAAFVILVKAVIAIGVSISMGFPVRAAVLVGFALSQVGEFSFILSRTGTQYGLLAGDIYQLFLAVSITTMAATPFVIALAPNAANLAMRLPLPKSMKLGWGSREETEAEERKDHLVIIGYGINGKNLSRAAAAADIPYLIIEMNSDTVRSEREKGEPIYFGDATQEAVLKHAGIQAARVVVIAISDPAATRAIIELSRRLNLGVYIIVRTRYIQELDALHELGANEVIPEEFETSVEIFTRVLNKYLVPRGEIEKFVAEVRSDSYEMFRSFTRRQQAFADLKLHAPDIEICSLRVGENSHVAGSTLADTELRKKHGVTALAIRRNTEILSNPHGDARLYANDVVVVVGTRSKLAAVSGLFRDLQEDA